MGFTFLESSSLFVATDREPKLDDMNTASNEIAFEFRCLPHELRVFFRVAKSHDAFDASSVIPRTIEQDDFTRCRQMLHVSLKVPLPAFHVTRLFQSYDSCPSRIQMIHESFDRAAFACRVSTLE